MIRFEQGNENGDYHYDSSNNVSIFQDTQSPDHVYYAWIGTWDDHDTAQHTNYWTTPEAALSEALETK